MGRAASAERSKGIANVTVVEKKTNDTWVLADAGWEASSFRNQQITEWHQCIVWYLAGSVRALSSLVGYSSRVNRNPKEADESPQLRYLRC